MSNTERVLYFPEGKIMKTIICDDEKSTCSELEEIILKYAKEKSVSLVTEVFYSGDTLLDYLKREKINILFLDIELPGKDGVMVGKYIREVLEEWTNEDDVCIVYARQTVSGIPVYPELSVMAQALAYDTPESSPVVAVCSTRGIESLRVYGLYDFQEDGENVPLKGFDEIAATVETKYENLLDESTYTVTRAKFYERAYINEDQQYTAEPIWYLEINDNNSQKYVMLVNAETGKEIYLM